MKNRTQQLPRTQQKIGRFSPTMIANKEPGMDYSFRRRADIEQGGGMDHLGFEPVGESNYAGEIWNGPRSMQQNSIGRKQVVLQDTILCKRPNETAQFFKAHEDEKYNAQCRLVMTASRSADGALRKLDPGAVIVDSSTGLEKAMPQRPGPTQEA